MNLLQSSEVLILVLLISVIAVIVLYGHISGNRTKVIVSGLISTQYKFLADDWRHQWYLKDNDELVIGLLISRLTGIAGQFDLEYDHKLNEDAQKITYDIIPREFEVGVKYNL